MGNIRNTKPRGAIDTPKENIDRLGTNEMNRLLGSISELTGEDLAIVMDAVSKGLIRQRDIAMRRAVDFETAVANVVTRPKVTPKMWRFILDEFIKPHITALRSPWIVEYIEKKAGKEDV